jgi:hypothetical protein
VKGYLEADIDCESSMNFELRKFFIGLLGLFSILLPGALLTWLLMGEAGLVVLGDRYPKLDGLQAGRPSCSRGVSSATCPSCRLLVR